jgi:hypothetical protein
MPIRTTANTYSRGIDWRRNPNFFLIAQTNNTVSVPTSAYVKHLQYPRPYINTCVGCRWPWSH